MAQLTALEEQIEIDFRNFLNKKLPGKYGQSNLFKEIWEERNHFSEISNSPLLPQGHFKWHWQFLHVMPKGTYPKMKLFKHNIILATPDEHNKQEQHDFFIERQNLLRRVYLRVIYNKKFD